MACPTSARLFGDIHDPDSEVVARDPRARRLCADAGVGDAARQSLPAAAHHRGRRQRRDRGARARHAVAPSDAGTARGGDESGVLGHLLHDAGRRGAGLFVALAARGAARGVPMAPAFVVARRSLRRGRSARRRPGGVVLPPRPARARVARGGDVAHVVAVARGDRAAGVHRAASRSGGWRRATPAPRRARTSCCRSPRIAVAALLWYCTAMIYACLRFIEEWAQPLTLVNFVLLGLASGLVARERARGAGRRARAARRWRRRRRSSRRSSPGHAHRGAAPQRRDPPPLDPADGDRHPRARASSQKSMGMSAGSFNTREFFHRASRRRCGGSGSRRSCSRSRCRWASCCSPGRRRWSPLCARRRAAAGARAARRPLAILRPGEAPAEPVLPGRVVSPAEPSSGAIVRRRRCTSPSERGVESGQTLTRGRSARERDGILRARLSSASACPLRSRPSNWSYPMTEPPLSLRRRQLLAGGAGALAGTGLIGLAGEAAAQAAAPAAAAAATGRGRCPRTSPGRIRTRSSSTARRRSRPSAAPSAPAASRRPSSSTSATTCPRPTRRSSPTATPGRSSIEGVRNPRMLTVADLKTIGVETVATVLQCSGNGRGYFPSKPSGTPWTVGAAGCVLWSGVPLRYVVEALGGVAPGMRLPHRHRRREAARQRRSADGHGRALGARSRR